MKDLFVYVFICVSIEAHLEKKTNKYRYILNYWKRTKSDIDFIIRSQRSS